MLILMLQHPASSLLSEPTVAELETMYYCLHMASNGQHSIIPQLWVNKNEKIETKDLIASDSTNNKPITYI